MNLLLAIALMIVAITVLVYTNLDSILRQTRVLHFMRGRPGQRGQGFSLNQWAATKKKPQSLFILGTLVGLLLGFAITKNMIGGVIGAGLGYLLPRMLLARSERKRLHKLNEQFAPSLILVANGMKAGQTLVQAFDLAATSLKEPIASEFLSISRQVRLGMPIDEALISFGRRVPLPESTILVKAMQISLQTGANLPAAIGQVAATISSRAKLERKIKTITAQGKAQGLIIGAAPLIIGIGFSVMNPQYFHTMVFSFWGNCIIVLVLVLQVIGFLMVRKITKVPT